MRIMPLLLALLALVAPVWSGEEFSLMQGQSFGGGGLRENGVSGIAGMGDLGATAYLPQVMEPQDFVSAVSPVGTVAPFASVEGGFSSQETAAYQSRPQYSAEDDFGIPGLVSPEMLALDKYNAANAAPAVADVALFDAFSMPFEPPLLFQPTSIPDPTPVALPASLPTFAAPVQYSEPVGVPALESVSSTYSVAGNIVDPQFVQPQFDQPRRVQPQYSAPVYSEPAHSDWQVIAPAPSFSPASSSPARSASPFPGFEPLTPQRFEPLAPQPVVAPQRVASVPPLLDSEFRPMPQHIEVPALSSPVPQAGGRGLNLPLPPAAMTSSHDSAPGLTPELLASSQEMVVPPFIMPPAHQAPYQRESVSEAMTIKSPSSMAAAARPPVAKASASRVAVVEEPPALMEKTAARPSAPPSRATPAPVRMRADESPASLGTITKPPVSKVVPTRPQATTEAAPSVVKAPVERAAPRARAAVREEEERIPSRSYASPRPAGDRKPTARKDAVADDMDDDEDAARKQSVLPNRTGMPALFARKRTTTLEKSELVRPSEPPLPPGIVLPR